MSSPYTIEPGSQAATGLCNCCGRETQVFRGFVFRDQNAFAVYLATYTDGHPENGTSMTLSIRGWGDGADRGDKQAVNLLWYQSSTGPSCRIVEPEQALFRENLDFLGPMLTRDEAMSSGRATEAFQIAAAIWTSDSRLTQSLA
jgi:hypothetical protein